MLRVYEEKQVINYIQLMLKDYGYKYLSCKFIRKQKNSRKIDKILQYF